MRIAYNPIEQRAARCGPARWRVVGVKGSTMATFKSIISAISTGIAQGARAEGAAAKLQAAETAPEAIKATIAADKARTFKAAKDGEIEAIKVAARDKGAALAATMIKAQTGADVDTAKRDAIAAAALAAIAAYAPAAAPAKGADKGAKGAKGSGIAQG